MVNRKDVRPFSSLWSLGPDTTKRQFVRDILKNTYGKIATHFDHTRRRPWPTTIAFRDEFSKGSRVIDMGCGNGRNALFFAEKGIMVTGVDTSPDLLEIARENARQREFGHFCEFIHGDVTEIPVEDEIFVGGLYIASLHHLATNDERLTSLNELTRVLSQGGKALISVWKRDLVKFQAFLDIWAKHPLFESGDVIIPWKNGNEEWPRYYHLFDEEGFKSLLDRSELVVKSIFHSGENLYARVEKE